MKNVVKEKLTQLIDDYGKQRSKVDNEKAKADLLNNEIKMLMEKHELDSFDGDNFSAKYIVQKREMWDEEALIKLMKSTDIKDIVKKKEYIDWDCLENAIYHDKLSKSVLMRMDKLRTIKETPTLRVSKLKEV